MKSKTTIGGNGYHNPFGSMWKWKSDSKSQQIKAYADKYPMLDNETMLKYIVRLENMIGVEEVIHDI